MQLANFTTPSHVTRDWASGTSKPVFYCYRFHISKLMCKIILLFSFTFRFHVAVTSYSPLNHKTKNLHYSYFSSNVISEVHHNAQQEGLRDRGGPLGDVLYVLGRQVRQGGEEGARGDLL